MPSQARTNSFWMPLGPRHPLKMLAHDHRSTSSRKICLRFSSWLRTWIETYNGYCIRIHLYYVCIKSSTRGRVNSSMLVSIEASIPRNQRFSIIINCACARSLEKGGKKKLGEKIQKEENNKKKKENEKSNRKM